MLKSLYSVYDKKTLVFDPPMAHVNDEDCMRHLKGVLLSNRNSMVCRFAHDYQIFKVGTFDDSVGRCEPTVPCELVAEIATLVDPEIMDHDIE